MDYIICAFYTDDPMYTKHAEDLKQSLIKLDMLKFHFDKIPPIENWVSACAVKPEMVKVWLEATDKDILYIDVDGRFIKKPILFDNYPHDIGVFYKNGEELISSVIYLKNTDKVKQLINRWVECQKQHPQIWDQKILQKVIEESSDLVLDVGMLPNNYCHILDPGEQPKPDTVIAQLQASRDHKDKQMTMLNLNSNAVLQLLRGETIKVSGISASNIAIKISDVDEARKLFNQKS